MSGFEFFVGLHQPSDAHHFDRVFLSVNRLKRYRRPERLTFPRWAMDCAGFSEISEHGRYRWPVEWYASEVERWRGVGELVFAVSPDWMCEAEVIQGCPRRCRPEGRKPCHKRGCFYGTGLDVSEHQRRTVESFRQLAALTDAPLLPVLQGYTPDEYRRCLDLYGGDLRQGARVGVGSVCRRNTNPAAVVEVLRAIKAERPDLRLHGFGIKTTSLENPQVRALLETGDSMAWSYRARIEGRDGNDWREAKNFEGRILSATDAAPVAMLWQASLFA